MVTFPTFGPTNRQLYPRPPQPTLGVPTCTGTCYACKQIVQLVMQKGIPSLVTPALTTATFSALGAVTGKRGTRAERAVIGGLLGLLVGGIVEAATPAAQKWVCGDCGCDNVSPHVG